MKLFATVVVVAASMASVQAQCNATDVGGLYGIMSNMTGTPGFQDNVLMPNCYSNSNTVSECAEAIVANLTVAHNSCNCTGAFGMALLRDLATCNSDCAVPDSLQCFGCLDTQDAGIGLNYSDIVACANPQVDCGTLPTCDSCNATQAALAPLPSGHCDALTPPTSPPPTSTPPPPAPECASQDRFGLGMTLLALGQQATADNVTFATNAQNCAGRNQTLCDAWIDQMMFTKCTCTRQFVPTLLFAALSCGDQCDDLSSPGCMTCIDNNGFKNSTGVALAEVAACGVATPDPSCGFSAKCESCGACANRPDFPAFVPSGQCTTHAEDKCGAVKSLSVILSNLQVVIGCFGACKAIGMPTEGEIDSCSKCISKAVGGASAGCDCLGAAVIGTLECADSDALVNCNEDPACVAASLTATCTGKLEAYTGLPIELFTHPVMTASECPTFPTEVICSAEGVDLRENPPAGSANTAVVGAAASALMAAVAAL